MSYFCGRIRYSHSSCMISTLRKLSLSDVVTYLQTFSLWLLVATLPLRICAFTRVVMIVAGVLFVVEYVVNKRWRDWHWSRDKWLYVAMIALYLFVFVWQIGSETMTPRWNKVVEQRLPFALCGVIGLLGFNPRVRLRDITWVFLFAAVATSVFIIYQSGGFSFFLHPWKRQSYYFVVNRIAYINSHMVYNLYLNVTLVFAAWLLSQKRIRRWERIVLSCACLWLFYILCLTEGRVGLFTTLAVVSLLILRWISRYGWKVIVPIGLLCSVFGGVLLLSNDRMTADHLFKYNPRKVIWNAGWKTVEEAPILGQGVCDARQTLIEKAHENEALYNFWRPYVEGKRNGNWYYISPHNAFLEVWGEYGLIGLFTLLFLFVYPIIIAPRKVRFYVLLIVGCFGIQYTFDAIIIPLLYCLPITLFISQSETSVGSVAQRPAAT